MKSCGAHNKSMGVAIYDLLGGERVLGPPPQSSLDWVAVTRAGLPLEAARELERQLSPIAGRGERQFASRSDAGSGVGLFLVSLILRAEGSELGRVLTPAESDVVMRMASVFARAIEVLGTREKASHWLMNSPNDALGGAVPASILDTSAGEHEVLALLERIEYGVYS